MKQMKKMATLLTALFLVQTLSNPLLTFAQVGVPEEESKAVEKSSTEKKQARVIDTGQNGGVDYEFDSDSLTLTFTSEGTLDTKIADMSFVGNTITGVSVETIIFEKDVSLPVDSSYFFGYNNGSTSPPVVMALKEVIGLEFLNASNVENMTGLFSYTENLKELAFSEIFDATSVQAMNSMFYFSGIEKIDLSNVKTSTALTDMYRMFYASQAKEIHFGTNFTVSGVRNMPWLFARTTNLEELDFGGNFDATKVTNMASMFWNTGLTEIDLHEVQTSTVLIDMEYMFEETLNLEKINFGENFETSSVADMEFMFWKSNIKEVDLSALTISDKMTNMRSMFRETSQLKSINFGENFDSSGVENVSSMFESAGVGEVDLSGLVFSDELTNMAAMFKNASNLVKVNFGENFDTSAVTTKADMFTGTAIKALAFGDKFRSSDATGLAEPIPSPVYTGKWVSTDGRIDYDNSEDLLLNGTNGEGFKTFVWERERYTLSFILDGGTGTFPDQSIEAETKITEPVSNPTKENFDFQGWYKTSGEKWDFDTDVMPSEPMTLEAHWKKQEFVVTFVNYDGQEVSSKNIDSGGYITSPPKLPARKGYTFNGWSTSKVGGAMWSFATDTVTQSMILYPRYVLDDVVVTYQNNDSELDTSVFYEEVVRYNSTLKMPTSPTRAGYAFQGWYTARTGGTLWNFNNKIDVDGEFPLYAHWAVLYTVTFKNSDGTTLKTQQVIDGQAAQAPNNTNRKDYTFLGWDKAFTSIKGNLVVTAKHKAIDVTFKPSVTSKTIGKKKTHTLNVQALNVEKSRVEYTIDKKYSNLASVNKASGKVTTKNKAGTFKVNVKVYAKNGTSKTMIVTYKTIHQVTDVLTNKGKKLATKASVKQGKTVALKTKAISTKKTQKATSPKMAYKTSNKKVATVDKKGKIKGVKKGTATITLTTTTADGAKIIKKVKVTVK